MNVRVQIAVPAAQREMRRSVGSRQGKICESSARRSEGGSSVSEGLGSDLECIRALWRGRVKAAFEGHTEAVNI